MVTLEDSSFILIETSPPLVQNIKKISPLTRYLQRLFAKPS